MDLFVYTLTVHSQERSRKQTRFYYTVHYKCVKPLGVVLTFLLMMYYDSESTLGKIYLPL